jgi:ATP-dependent Clp protease ATP-binding subunit ClpB
VLFSLTSRSSFSLVLCHANSFNRSNRIEKASKEFNQIFLQVLDNGRLTDSRGTVVNFKNTVIIMTSNLGSVFINELPDDGKEIPADVKESVNGSIRAHFAPEFINRIDSIVIFKPLGRAQVRTIVDIRIAEVNKRLKSKNIKLNLDSDAEDYLAAIGYHPTYGARPLNRAIQNELLHPLSRAILEESVLNDEEVVVAFDGKNNRLVVVPNHEAAIGMEVDEDSEMDEDGIEIEEIDD